MAGETCFTKNQLHFFRICHLATNVLPAQLRIIFVDLWNKYFSSLNGTWSNTAANGAIFFSKESELNKKRNSDMLNEMKHGDIEKWDCTMLFYGILYSSSIGQNLCPSIRGYVNHLRDFRNKSFAHVSKGELTACDFQTAFNQLLQALVSLQCDVSAMKEVQNLNSFSTEEIYELRSKLMMEKEAQAKIDLRISDLESRVVVLENCCCKFSNDDDDVYSNVIVDEHTAQNSNVRFKILPDKPKHRVVKRKQVDDTVNSLHELRTLHDGKITGAFIVGHPLSGKTECAASIANILVNKGLENVAIMNAETDECFLHSMKELTKKLNCHTASFSSLEKATVRSQIELLSLLIKEKLLGLSSTWLIIFDGVSMETKDLLDYLPRPGEQGSGQILVTTHDHSIAPKCPYTVSVTMDQLTIDETNILMNSLVGETVTELAEVIGEILDFNVAFIVSAVKNTSQISRRQNLTLIDALHQMIKNVKECHKEEDWAYFIAALDEVAQARIKTVLKTFIARSGLIKEFLHICTLARGKIVSLSAVSNFLTSSLNFEKSDVESAIKNISFVQILDGRNIRINGVFYQLLLDLFTPELGDEKMVFRLMKLCRFFTANLCDPEVANIFKEMSFNIMKYVSFLDVSKSEELKILYYDLGKAFLCISMDYASALRYLTAAMSIFEKSNTTEHPGYARLLNILGNVLRLTGKLEAAKKYLRMSLKLLQNTSGGDASEDFANCVSSLGLVFLAQGNMKQAREFHHRALYIREQLHGNEHVTTAASLNNIGGVYHECGDLAKAKSYYWKALEIKGRNYGWDSPHMANSFNNIAEISHEQGEFCDAILIHQRALKIRQRLHGDDHPDVSDSMNNIAVVYRKLGELTTAKKYHMKALDIRKKVYGEKHLEVASSLCSLGEISYNEGDLAAAEEFHIEALSIRDHHSVTSWHPDVITSLHNLMLVYSADEKFSLATAYAYEMFKLCEKVHGCRDRKTVEAYRKLTNLSRRSCQGRSHYLYSTVYEKIERLSCL